MKRVEGSERVALTFIYNTRTACEDASSDFCGVSLWGVEEAIFNQVGVELKKRSPGFYVYAKAEPATSLVARETGEKKPETGREVRRLFVGMLREPAPAK